MTEVAPRRSTRWTLQPGWPLVAAFLTYPLWWAFGIPMLAFPVATALLLLGVRRRPAMSAPRWAGLWLLFLVWTVLSTVTILDQPDRLFAWVYRDLSYVTAFGLLVVVTTYRRVLSTGRVARAVYVLWAFSVVGGVLGVIAPDIDFAAPISYLLPRSVQSNGLIARIVHPSFSETSFVYGVPRPSALYGFTNEWAAAMGVLTPFAVYARGHLRSVWARRGFWALLVVSLGPVIISVNRGLWISLAVAIVFVALQSAVHGRISVLIGMIASAALIGAVALFTPLSQVIATRLSNDNLGTRQTLVQGAIDSVSQSPVLGYGAPIQTTLDNVHGLSVGTHGQLWTLLVSHGIPGASLYIAFFVVTLLSLRGVPTRCWWLQASVVVLLIQLPFYNAVGVPLAVAMISLGLLHRERLAQTAARLRRAQPRPLHLLDARPTPEGHS